MHYKNTREVIRAVRGMHLNRALQFLKNVQEKKEIVPFTRCLALPPTPSIHRSRAPASLSPSCLVRTKPALTLCLVSIFSRYSHGGGRKAQCKQFGHPLGRWPKKSAELVYGLLKNAESNAELKVGVWTGYCAVVEWHRAVWSSPGVGSGHAAASTSDARAIHGIRRADGGVERLRSDVLAWRALPSVACASIVERALTLRVLMQGLDVDALEIKHAMCNRAPKMRRRTYRAHGRINRKCSQSAHGHV